MTTRREPAFRDRLRTDLPWADAICDGRRAVDVREAPLPQTLPPAGTDPFSGNVRGIVQTREGLVLSSHPFASTTWGAMIIRVVFPDGHVVASVVGDLDQRNGTPDGIWQSYAAGGHGFFSRAFIPHHYLVGVTKAHQLDGVSVAAHALRNALADPYSFFRHGVPETRGGANPAQELIDLTSHGFTSWVDGSLIFGAGVTRGDVMAAVDGGFDIGLDDDWEWVAKCGPNDWAYVHANGWADLRRLQEAGWTLGAMQWLHRSEVLDFLSAIPTSAHEGRVAADTAWGTEVHLDDWLRVAGSPQMASALMEAGIGYHEAALMVSQGHAWNMDTLVMLAALRGTHGPAGVS